MDSKARIAKEKKEEMERERRFGKWLVDESQNIRIRSKEIKVSRDADQNKKMASKITEVLLKEAQKRYGDELYVHQEEDDNYKKIKRFDDYRVFADSSAWLPYLGFDEKDNNDLMRKLRASIMDDIIKMNNKKQNKKKILTTFKIRDETMSRLKNYLNHKDELKNAIEKYTDLTEDPPIHNTRTGGPKEETITEMYKTIWSKSKYSKIIEDWSKIKSKHPKYSDLNAKKWDEKWKTLPEKEKVKGPPEGSDIKILATIHKYRQSHIPTAVVFVTHDSDFTFFKNEIYDKLDIVLIDVYSLYTHMKRK